MNAQEKLAEVKKILLSAVGIESTEKEVEEVQLAKAKLKDGSEIEASSFEVGSEVYILVEGESVLATEGEYELEDGSFVVVSSEGVISEVKPKPEEDEASEEGGEEVEAEEVPEGDEEAVEESQEEPKEEKEFVSKEEFDALKELVESMSQMMPMLSKLKEEREAEQLELSKEVDEIKHSPEALVEKEFSPFKKVSNNPMSDIWEKVSKIK